MKRRFNETLYLTEDILQKLGEGRHLGPWDFANLFFPRDTNRKQFDCAFKFLSEMNKVG